VTPFPIHTDRNSNPLSSPLSRSVTAYRGFRDRMHLPPLVNEKSGQLNENTADFIRPYAKKWREKSIFQVLLHYRAARFQDFVNLSQQVSSIY